MMDDELTREEHEALAALPSEADASDLLEERTVRALGDAGLLRRRRLRPASPTFAWAAAAAACVIFFVAGFAVGHGRNTSSTAQLGADSAREQTLPAGRQDSSPRNPAGTTTVAQSESVAADGVHYVVWF